MKLNRILRTSVLVMFLASQFFLVTNQASFVSTAFACYTWQGGARIGLRSGSEIRTGSGLNYQVHTIVPEDNWQVDIIGGPRYADGKEWWDISRQNLDGGGTGWVYKEQSGYDLCGDSPPNPGKLDLVDNLSLQSDGSGQWPPVVGDKLIAHIKVRNSGGQTLSLENIGVRGRKNGGEFWDIGWWSAELGPGQEWQLDPNNERPLEAGSYSFRISYKDNSGWHEIGNEINFSVSAPPANPGQVKLVDNLSLQSEGSGQWPPVVGDKLIAHIKVRNSGGQTLNLENIGVRGRKNGGEFWDIGWWSAELGPGQEWQLDPNNERPLEAGKYSFRISYKDNSGWHEIGNEINFSVSAPPPDPGQVKLVDNLSLQSDGSGQWPPMVGDKLIAHIKVRNSGGQTLNLENIGVRGRKNGSESWDIGWWPAELGPGQVWELNPNNEHPLEAGNYSFRISYKDNSGWHEIGNEINFSVSASPATPGDVELTEAPVPNQPQEPNSSSSGEWQVGARVGLCAGAQIRSGSDFNKPTHTIVPENNWQVDIIGGPRNADNVTWWNISRANIDGGGTGWIYFEQANLAQCSTPLNTPPPIETIQAPQIETVPLPLDGPSYDPNFWCFLPSFCVQAAVSTACEPQCVLTARENRKDLVLWSGSGTSDQILATAKTMPEFPYQGQQQQVRVRAENESPQAGDLVIWPSGCGGAWSRQDKDMNQLPGGHIGYVTSGNPFRISDSNWGDPISGGSCAIRTNLEIPIKSCMEFITSPYSVGDETTPQQVETAPQQPVDKCSQYNGLRWFWCKITGK